MALKALDPANSKPPELVIGLCAAVGTPLTFFTNILVETLKIRNYSQDVVHLSDYTAAVKLKTEPPPKGCDEYTRIRTLIKRGNELRELAARGDVLALLAASDLNTRRPASPPSEFPQHATIIRQIKHPDEAHCFREIYQDGFHLVGIYCPSEVRANNLIVHGGMTEEQANELIRIDEYEPPKWGQKFRDSFYLSDVFIEITGPEAATPEVNAQSERFLNLLFAQGIITPTRDEYGMFLAAAADLRSSSPSRQVGAAILSKAGDILAVGTNEVPCYGGGQYWGDEDEDRRDHIIGMDSTTEMQNDALEEILVHVDPAWGTLSATDRSKRLQELSARLGGTRVMNLTEFGRAVHAEMEAIISAARVGVSIRGGTLYTTTFPCHGCAKHIVGAGLNRVVYIEPYPKSLAIELHSDSIAIDATSEEHPAKANFEPFVGVAPRRYMDFFSDKTQQGIRVRGKDSSGKIVDSGPGLRITMNPYNYIERERIAALEASQITKPERQS